MLAVARQLALQAEVNNARFVRSFGVMFFADPAAAFAGIAAALRRGGRLAFLCWQPDLRNELFGIPLQAFGTHMPLPGPAVGDLFTDPRRVQALLSSSGWERIRVDPVTEPAWVGADVADVMDYVRGMPMVQALSTSLGDDVLTGRILADIAEAYTARERPDGVWVHAAAWLVSAHRA